jgi:large subunit ribosomal protein L24
MRGEYTGIEGKIEKVNTRRGTLAIEGVQREKVRGGNVKVQIDASNVQVIGLKLEDKLRDNRLHGNKKNPEKVKLNTKKSRKILSRTKKSDKDRELKNG